MRLSPLCLLTALGAVSACTKQSPSKAPAEQSAGLEKALAVAPPRPVEHTLSVTTYCPGKPRSQDEMNALTSIKVIDPAGKQTVTCEGCVIATGSHGGLTGPGCSTAGWFTTLGTYRLMLKQGGSVPVEHTWDFKVEPLTADINATIQSATPGDPQLSLTTSQVLPGVFIGLGADSTPEKVRVVFTNLSKVSLGPGGLTSVYEDDNTFLGYCERPRGKVTIEPGMSYVFECTSMNTVQPVWRSTFAGAVNHFSARHYQLRSFVSQDDQTTFALQGEGTVVAPKP